MMLHEAGVRSGLHLVRRRSVRCPALRLEGDRTERGEAAQEVQPETAAQLVLRARRSALSQCHSARRNSMPGCRSSSSSTRVAGTRPAGRACSTRHVSAAFYLALAAGAALGGLAAVLGARIQRPADRVSFRLRLFRQHHLVQAVVRRALRRAFAGPAAHPQDHRGRPAALEARARLHHRRGSFQGSLRQRVALQCDAERLSQSCRMR